MKKWELWSNKLALLLEIRIPRYLFSEILPRTKFVLHGFCDSLTQSYAAVCYIRVFDSSSQRYKCRIVAAKSKWHSKEDIADEVTKALQILVH